MKLFKDSLQRPWEVEFNVGQRERVLEELKIDLYEFDASDWKLWGRIVEDYGLTVSILFVLCRGQAHAHSIDRASFQRGMTGQALWDGGNALLQELLDFFPDARKRASLKMTVEKSREIQEIKAAAALKALEEVNPASLAKQLIASFGSWPGTLVLTQPDLRGIAWQ